MRRGHQLQLLIHHPRDRSLGPFRTGGGGGGGGGATWARPRIENIPDLPLATEEHDYFIARVTWDLYY